MEVVFHHLGHSLFPRAAVLCLGSQLCPTLCDSMDCSPPGSSLYGISGKNTGVAMPSSRGSSQPEAENQVSRITGRFFTIWTTRGTLFASSKSQILTSFSEWEKHRDITHLWGWLIRVQLGVCLPRKWQLASVVLFLSSHLQEWWWQQQSWDMHRKEVNCTSVFPAASWITAGEGWTCGIRRSTGRCKAYLVCTTVLAAL